MFGRRRSAKDLLQKVSSQLKGDIKSNREKPAKYESPEIEDDEIAAYLRKAKQKQPLEQKEEPRWDKYDQSDDEDVKDKQIKSEDEDDILQNVVFDFEGLQLADDIPEPIYNQTFTEPSQDLKQVDKSRKSVTPDLLEESIIEEVPSLPPKSKVKSAEPTFFASNIFDISALGAGINVVPSSPPSNRSSPSTVEPSSASVYNIQSLSALRVDEQQRNISRSPSPESVSLRTQATEEAVSERSNSRSLSSHTRSSSFSTNTDDYSESSVAETSSYSSRNSRSRHRKRRKSSSDGEGREKKDIEIQCSLSHHYPVSHLGAQAYHPAYTVPYHHLSLGLAQRSYNMPPLNNAEAVVPELEVMNTAVKDLLATQILMIKQFVSSQRLLHEQLMASIPANHSYTTLEETKQFIEDSKNRIPTLEEVLLRRNETPSLEPSEHSLMT